MITHAMVDQAWRYGCACGALVGSTVTWLLITATRRHPHQQARLYDQDAPENQL